MRISLLHKKIKNKIKSTGINSVLIMSDASYPILTESLFQQVCRDTEPVRCAISQIKLPEDVSSEPRRHTPSDWTPLTCVQEDSEESGQKEKTHSLPDDVGRNIGAGQLLWTCEQGRKNRTQESAHHPRRVTGKQQSERHSLATGDKPWAHTENHVTSRARGRSSLIEIGLFRRKDKCVSWSVTDVGVVNSFNVN